MAKRLRGFLMVALIGWMLAASMGAAQTVAPRETELFEQARATGLLADYVAYLAEFPEGNFAEVVKFEIEWGFAPGEVAAAMAKANVATVAPQTEVTFTTPLAVGPEGVKGRSIEQLLLGSPQFPPIEGIPQELWKDQKCTNCHKWTSTALCEQGATYLETNATAALEKPHPYGLDFKLALRAYAAGGCRQN